MTSRSLTHGRDPALEAAPIRRGCRSTGSQVGGVGVEPSAAPQNPVAIGHGQEEGVPSHLLDSRHRRGSVAADPTSRGRIECSRPRGRRGPATARRRSRRFPPRSLEVPAAYVSLEFSP